MNYTFSTLWLSWLQDWFHSIRLSVLIDHSREMKLFLNVASILNPEEVDILCTLLLVAKIIVSDSVPKPCMEYDILWSEFTSSCWVSLRTVVRRGGMYVRLQKFDETDPIGSDNSKYFMPSFHKRTSR